MRVMRTSQDLAGRRVLLTGISDASSLALSIGRVLLQQGADLVCSGLGPTPHRTGLSERARELLERTYAGFRETVEKELGEEVPTLACDLASEESTQDLAEGLREEGLHIDGVVHAVAFDRTLRPGSDVSLLETPRDAFLDCMTVSAYSLISLLRALVNADRLAEGASVVSLSYIGAERVVSHPYRNVAVAKAALERITRELAFELGHSHQVRVNAVRFSAYSESKAGGAIPGLAEAARSAQERAPLGNALPDALGLEVAHLLRPGVAITGEIRHVDGGYNVLA